MRTIRPSGALSKRRSKHALNIQSFDSGAGCHDVRDGIQSADFMKLNILRRNPVNLSFCHRDALEYGYASNLDKVAQPSALLDQATYVSKGACVSVIVVNMADAIVAANLKLPARDPLAGTALEFGVNLPAKTQCGDSRMKYAFLDTEVSKSPDRHVSTDARKAVEI